MSAEKCPVDHSKLANDSCSSSSTSDKCPVDHASMQKDACPVDHTTRKSWTDLFGSKTSSDAASPPPAHHPNGAPSHLPVGRETSSIPRVDGTKWVYPSESQFFAAMARKNHDPQAKDMKVVVPIHNAVNERAWAELMKWEAGQGGEKCGGVKLVSFKGRPNDRTPRARWKTLLG
ncbi:cytochrome c/c1 heme-lyase [Abortiporus biennis]|nr:cytochrome c/c1 heme-lyase [Abortiporus biennis]